MVLSGLTKKLGESLSIIALSGSFLGCAADPNFARLSVNSEPPGARVYQNGSYVGNTPLNLTYRINEENYSSGKLVCTPLIFAKEGYFPKKREIKLNVSPTWRPDPNNFLAGGQVFDYSVLEILEGDPRYSYQRIEQEIKTDNTNRDSPVGEANKALQTLMLLRELSN